MLPAYNAESTLRRTVDELDRGGNQKTCYRAALDMDADMVVMVHPDYQYSPLLVPAMGAMIAYGEYDFVLPDSHPERCLARDAALQVRGQPRADATPKTSYSTTR